MNPLPVGTYHRQGIGDIRFDGCEGGGVIYIKERRSGTPNARSVGYPLLFLLVGLCTHSKKDAKYFKKSIKGGQISWPDSSAVAQCPRCRKCTDPRSAGKWTASDAPMLAMQPIIGFPGAHEALQRTYSPHLIPASFLPPLRRRSLFSGQRVEHRVAAAKSFVPGF